MNSPKGRGKPQKSLEEEEEKMLSEAPSQLIGD
jgi:hypothetical protein